MLIAIAIALVLSQPRIMLTSSAFATAYGSLRSTMTREADASPLAAIDREIPAQIRLRDGQTRQGAVAHELYWRTLDAYVYGCDSVDDLNALARGAPATIGGFLEAGKTLRALAGAIESRLGNPVGAESLNARLAQWNGGLAKQEESLLAEAGVLIGVEPLPSRIQIVLIPESGGKEGMTIRTPGGLRIVMGAEKYQGEDFAEVVLHECLHVLDATAPSTGLFAELRKALAAMAPDEPEKIVHAAIFALAAELVRKELDPAHVDVGERVGAYARGLRAEHERGAGPPRAGAHNPTPRAAAVEAIARGSGAFVR